LIKRNVKSFRLKKTLCSLQLTKVFTYTSGSISRSVPRTKVWSVTGIIHISSFNEIFPWQTGKYEPGNKQKHVVRYAGLPSNFYTLSRNKLVSKGTLFFRLCSFHRAQTGSWAHPVSHAVRIESLCSGLNRPRREHYHSSPYHAEGNKWTHSLVVSHDAIFNEIWKNIILTLLWILRYIQGGSNMTWTNCDLITHKSSRSYLNHLVLGEWVLRPGEGRTDRLWQYIWMLKQRVFMHIVKQIKYCVSYCLLSVGMHAFRRFAWLSQK
jgi:hypothetical protein